MARRSCRSGLDWRRALPLVVLTIAAWPAIASAGPAKGVLDDDSYQRDLPSRHGGTLSPFPEMDEPGGGEGSGEGNGNGDPSGKRGGSKGGDRSSGGPDGANGSNGGTGSNGTNGGNGSNGGTSGGNGSNGGTSGGNGSNGGTSGGEARGQQPKPWGDGSPGDERSIRSDRGGPGDPSAWDGDGAWDPDKPQQPEDSWEHDREPSDEPARERVDIQDRDPPSSAPPERRSPPSLGGGGQVFGFLFKVILFAIAAIVIFFVAQAIVKALRNRTASVEEEDGDAGEADGVLPKRKAKPASLDLADTLAQEGRFAEAIHELLRCAILALAKKLARPVEDSMTGREIVANVTVDDDGRAALRVLVQAVEISLFGAVPMTRDDFQRCRSSYDFLTGRAAAQDPAGA